MSDDKGRFLRLYFDRLERDHPAVWFDPTCLSTYARLLALSEKAWPAMPELPKAARRADLAKLQADGMIEYLPNDRFVLRGWITERQERAAAARKAVSSRADRSSVPTPVPTDVGSSVPPSVLPVRAPASFSSSSSTTTNENGSNGFPAIGSDLDALDTYHELTRWRPWGAWSGKALQKAIADYGNDAVDAALRAAYDDDPERDTLMDRSMAKLARDAEKARQARPKPRVVKVPRDEAAIARAKRELLSGGAA